MRRPLLSIVLAAIPAVAAAQPGLSPPPPTPPVAPVAPPAPPAPPAPAPPAPPAAPAIDYTVGDDIPCMVNIVRAPDDVRQVIEAWVAAEPSCSTTLTLRVVATEGGYFLFAQRSDGRIHERLVPDAQTAGVLVTSWIAADSSAGDAVFGPPSPPTAPAAPLPPLPPIPPVPPVPADSDDEVEVFETESRVVIIDDGDPSRVGRYITATALGSTIGLTGARVEVDLIQQGALGVLGAVQYSKSKMDVYADSTYGSLWTDDFKAVIAGTATYNAETYSLRAAIGAGVVFTRGMYNDMGPEAVWGGSKMVSPTAEGSLMLSRKFGTGQRWAIALGVVATAIKQRHDLEIPIVTIDDIERINEGLEREGLLVEAMVGLRKRI